MKQKLSVKPIRSARDRKAFLELPWSIYRDDPAWIPPLRFDRAQQISERSNPFFRHARWQGFVAWDGDTPVGRISAQIDDLNKDLGRPTLGYFGMLEAIDDAAVFAALLQAAVGDGASRSGRSRRPPHLLMQPSRRGAAPFASVGCFPPTPPRQAVGSQLQPLRVERRAAAPLPALRSRRWQERPLRARSPASSRGSPTR